MSNKKEKTMTEPEKTDMGIFVALDLGATEVRAIAARKDDNGNFVTLDTACTTSEGIQRGAIQNIEMVKGAIQHVLTDLENSIKRIYNEKISDIYEKINVHINKVYVALNGGSIKTKTNRVSRRLGGEIITQNLLDEFDRENKNILLDNNLEILDIQPLQFLVDDEENSSPIGCRCEVIQATYQIILGKSVLLSNLKACLNGIGRELAGYIIAPQATADACISKNEKELGIVMMDFGDSTTNVSIYYKGKLHYAISMPLGSNLITNDIAQLRIVKSEAERIKQIGNCNLDRTNPKSNFLIGLTTGKEVSYHIICEVIERRIDTILEYAKLAIEESHLRVGPQLDQIVLLGKGNQLKGLENKVQAKLGLTAHKGQILAQYAPLIKGNAAAINFASAIGTLLSAKENCAYSTKQAQRPEPQKKHGWEKFTSWTQSLFADEIPEQIEDNEKKEDQKPTNKN